jgi:Uma2 family endonuclease
VDEARLPRSGCRFQGVTENGEFPLLAGIHRRDTGGVSAIPNPGVSVAEYLATSYRPDRDYVDGEVQERNLGEFDHSLLQGLLFRLFFDNRESWNVRVSPEQRIQLGPQRFRIPDICVMSRETPKEQVVTYPPLIAIEILSPEDTLQRMRQRVDDYLSFGTKHVWIIDPAARDGYLCTTRGFEEPQDGVLEIPATPIRVVLSELFAELDRA